MAMPVTARLRALAAQVPALRRARGAAVAAADAWRSWTLATPHGAPWPVAGPEPTFPHLVSQACTDMQIRSPEYRAWGERLRVRDVYVHRKQWEWFYIAQALEEAGVVGPGATGIGFGVGREPLTPWFAAQGCAVLATDFPGGEHAEEWSSTGELARDLSELDADGICDPDAFAQLVRFEPLDMRHLPSAGQYDFAWSSCALEHLGSIDAGLEFLHRHLDLLAPGGVGVHTTELNVSSDDHTIDHGPTVLFRRRDLERLAAEIAPRAEVMPLNFTLGSNPNDLYVAPPDAFTNVMIRLAFGEFVTTSFGLIVRKR